MATRTCAACRGEADRDDLVRLVVDPESGRVVVDRKARLPGRGAWVHPTRDCVMLLEKKAGALSHALDAPVSADGLLDAIRRETLSAALDGLSLAAAAGALVGGHDVLVQAMAEGRVVDVVLANDSAERTVTDLRRAAGETPFTTVPLDREALGARVGKGARAALGVTASRATQALRRQLHRLRALG